MKPHIPSIPILIIICYCFVLNAQNTSKSDSSQQTNIRHQDIDSLEKEIDLHVFRIVLPDERKLLPKNVKPKKIAGLVMGILMTAGGTALILTSDHDDDTFFFSWEPIAIFSGGGLLISGISIATYNATKLAKQKNNTRGLGFGVGPHGIGMMIAIK